MVEHLLPRKQKRLGSSPRGGSIHTKAPAFIASGPSLTLLCLAYVIWLNVIDVGTFAGGVGMLGVIVALITIDGVLRLVAVYTTLNGAAELSTNVLGSGIVTINPLASTVGVTVGSLEISANVVSVG
jgi:hypothetical protein